MITLSNYAGPIEPVQTNALISLFGSDPNETATDSMSEFKQNDHIKFY